MADLSKLRFNGTDYNVKDASAPLRKFTNYSKTGNLPITSDDTTQTAIGKLEKALDDKINTSAKGTSNGVAELDTNGKVPSSQLPSYVDDVLEYSAKSSFPATGETGKIYVDTTTNKTYRWSGSAYVEISASLALGETSSTAYYGDKGKTAYTHSQSTHARTDATKAEISNGVLAINGTATNIGNFKSVSTVASQGLSDTEKSNARANIGAGTSSLTVGTGASNAAAGNHTHGNIQNGGTLQTNDITIASGDKLVVTDSSDSSKIARTSISFDGSTTSQALTKAGSWQTFNNYTHPTDGANTGSFGPSASVSPGFGGTFSVPRVTVNAKGHVTAASTKTITMPNFTATPYTKPTKHSNITSIDSGGYIQIGKLVIVNMRFTVGTACGQYTDLFTDLPLPLTPLSGGSACVACSSNNNTLMICANGRMQNYDSGSLAAGVYVVSTVYIGQ